MTADPHWNFAARIVERMGACACLIDAATGKATSPGDLPPLVRAHAASLISAGLTKGDRILIGCTISPPSALVYLGAIYAGLVAVPVEERSLTDRAAQLLQATGAKAAWTEAGLQKARLPPQSVIRLKGNLSKAGMADRPPAACGPSDLAALMATSGSTGTPRFVMVSHQNLIANTEAIIRSQGLSADERAMLVLPLSYCFGASILHTHLYQGGSIVFDRRFMFPDKVLDAINQYECTTFAGVPTAYNTLLRRSKLSKVKLPSLRRFLQAGGALAAERITEIRTSARGPKFYVMYGQTEGTARISCLAPEDLGRKLGSVGRPLDNLTVRIADDLNLSLPKGHVGEIQVKGPSVTLGYLNQLEATRSVFQDGWLRTGDLGHLDDEGFLWIDGRKGLFVKMRGVRVSFAEIEDRVAAIPGVYECAATAVPHPESGEAFALFIVPEEGAGDVISDVRRSLPPYWTCESLQIVPEIPKSMSGKVLRTSLPLGQTESQ